MSKAVTRSYSLHVTWAADGSRSGGSIAAMRTVGALRSMGSDARVAAVAELGHSDAALPAPWLADRALQRLTYPLGLHDVHRVSSLAVLRDPTWRDASIVHLHVIHSGVFNYALLPVVCRGKKVVLTLHDMWPLTGNCIYSYDCERWRTGCGHCPYPDRYPPMRRDASAVGWLAKRWAWGHVDLSVVAPSRWLARVARESFLGTAPVHHVPYPIDTRVFRPRDGSAVRARLGIAPDRFVLLFSAHDLSDPRKGGDLVPKAVAALPSALQRRTTVLTFGNSAPQLPPSAAVQTVHLGYLAGEEAACEAFAAADLFVFPSRADNLPLVVQESLACGTPVVASDVGGIPDLVRPGLTGDLFAADDVAALCTAIEHWAADPAKRAAAATACRAIAEAEYGYEVISRAMLEVYGEAAAHRGPAAR